MKGHEQKTEQFEEVAEKKGVRPALIIEAALILAVVVGGVFFGVKYLRKAPTPAPTGGELTRRTVGESKTRKDQLLGNIDKLIVQQSQQWGQMQINKSVDGSPLSVGKQKFNTGIGTHAVSNIRFNLNKKYKTFSGQCGVDDEQGGAGTVSFRILGDQKVLFSTPVMKGGDAPQKFQVSVAGVSSLDLIVDNGGDNINSDHADWLDLKLE